MVERAGCKVAVMAKQNQNASPTKDIEGAVASIGRIFKKVRAVMMK